MHFLRMQLWVQSVSNIHGIVSADVECYVFCLLIFFFFSSRRRHTRSCLVSWARRCVQETVSTQSTWANRRDMPFVTIFDMIKNKLSRVEFLWGNCICYSNFLTSAKQVSGQCKCKQNQYYRFQNSCHFNKLWPKINKQSGSQTDF
eukprot:TRINITY_DN8699_c0_g1_i2.p2 TRINITY_DN8699_c0_g1~~TRINITY_DN8699_c0_g1_i2.p2  ORF type:complete len:146 (-),score=10.24 TRINITY_DN8699_c0_g1_i2:602-1039(-)